MIPYFAQPSLLLGPVRIHAFGALVAVAVILGSELAIRRCRRTGLDAGACADLALYAVVAGFLGAHLFSVLAYYPGEALRHPVLLLKVWENISSFGGFAGGLLGIALWFRLRGTKIDRAARLRHLDAVAYALPFAWTVGRLACSVAHDHPGTVTAFPLGISLATEEARLFIASAYRDAGRLAELPARDALAALAFHDLGWYEFLYTAFAIVPAFLVLGGKPRGAGFYPVAFVLLYAPVRFFLDFLRLADARYAGLTPGQFAAAGFFLAAALLVRGTVRPRGAA